MPRRFLVTVLAAATVALALAPASAWAGDPRDDSRAAFLRGVSEAHKNHFTSARDAFLEAYRLFPHPSILLNLGVARMHTGEYVAAEEALARFLVDDGGASPEDLANARATLAVVRKHIGTLRIRVAPDGARGTLDGQALPLVAGTFVEVRAVVGPAELRVEADGYAPLVQQLIVSHEDNPTLDLALVRPDALAPTPTSSPPAGGRPRNRWLGWGLVSGASACAIVGTVAGVEAIVLAHDYNTPGSTRYQSPTTRSEGIAWRTSSDVLFATAIVAGAVGTYVLLKPAGGAATATMRVEVGPFHAALRADF